MKPLNCACSTCSNAAANLYVMGFMAVSPLQLGDRGGISNLLRFAKYALAGASLLTVRSPLAQLFESPRYEQVHILLRRDFTDLPEHSKLMCAEVDFSTDPTMVCGVPNTIRFSEIAASTACRKVRQRCPLLAPATEGRAAALAFLTRFSLPRLRAPLLSLELVGFGSQSCCCAADSVLRRRGLRSLDVPRATSDAAARVSASGRRQRLTIARNQRPLCLERRVWLTLE